MARSELGPAKSGTWTVASGPARLGSKVSRARLLHLCCCLVHCSMLLPRSCAQIARLPLGRRALSVSAPLRSAEQQVQLGPVRPRLRADLTPAGVLRLRVDRPVVQPLLRGLATAPYTCRAADTLRLPQLTVRRHRAQPEPMEGDDPEVPAGDRPAARTEEIRRRDGVPCELGCCIADSRTWGIQTSPSSSRARCSRAPAARSSSLGLFAIASVCRHVLSTIGTMWSSAPMGRSRASSRWALRQL